MENFNYYSTYSSLNKCELFNLATFIVEENYYHHDIHSIKSIEEDAQLIYLEEEKFNNSKIFLTRDNMNSIIGSIRVFKWDYCTELPLEKIFGIKAKSIFQDENQEIWHIGRFAIKKGADLKGFNVFKTLMALGLNEICKNKNSIALAECDVKLLRILTLLGFESKVLANSVNYLGSETIPVFFTYESIKNFLEKNQALLHKEIISLHESVVFQAIA